MKVTLLISTYNRPDALNVVLDSVSRQTRMPDEIVVCDDGSGPDTAAVIERWRKRMSAPLIHVWQPDEGFRLAASRNKGIAASTGDYIIQIDGDVMLDRHFVADHARKAVPGFYIKGSRVRLTPDGTDEICAGGKSFKVPFFSRRVLKDRMKNFRCAPLGILYGCRYRTKGNAIGCNMSFWRDDFLRVNGYDEEFVGWGVEDTDLCMRLEVSGIRTFKLFRMGLCWHLWHRESSNPHLAEAYRYMNQRLASGHIRTDKGIDQYLKK
ncbi:MAG: glycosyltransferase [Muribaculaceae bacterium]|nr:glycosyltransferase [Muribaculaceae bacterium]